MDKDSGRLQDYLEQLLNLSRGLNSSLRLEEVLSRAIDSVVEFVRAERGFIMLVNENGKLVLKSYKNIDLRLARDMEGISRTILNASAREGKSIISVNAQTDPRFKSSESVKLEGLRSVICVPLKVKGKITGVIYLDNRIEEGMFNDFHLRLLEAFANQAAIAIENARLHENLISSYDEQIRLAKELSEQEKMRYACEEANRLKSDFVNIVSHELRGPLTVIKTYTSFLERNAGSGKSGLGDKTWSDIYSTMDQEVDRLLGLINKMLDVAFLDAGKQMTPDCRNIDISKIINDIVKLQGTSKFFKPDRHVIIRDVPEDLPPVPCDRDKITQILSNLIENALKYSPDGGEVRISVKKSDGYFRFSVSDQGLGIPEEDQARIFKKYERVDHDGRAIPGTGLGLYLAKSLVELHGEKLKLKSKPGKGSVFYFDLPDILPE